MLVNLDIPPVMSSMKSFRSAFRSDIIVQIVYKQLSLKLLISCGQVVMTQPVDCCVHLFFEPLVISCTTVAIIRLRCSRIHYLSSFLSIVYLFRPYAE